MKQTMLFVILVLLLLLPATVGAAPELPQTAVAAGLLAEREAVNLPGWVGGLLAVIALILPLAFQYWVRQK